MQIRGYDAFEVQTVAWKFKNRTTLLVINPTNSQKKLQIGGLEGKIATPFLTDEKRDMKKQTPVPIRGKGVNLKIPKRSILVLVGEK